MSSWSREGLAARLRATLPPPFGRALAWRVVVVWLGIHVVAAVIMQFSGTPAYRTFLMPVVALLWLWGFVLVALLLDMRTRSEHLILANLAVRRRVVALLVVGECALLEAGAQLITLTTLGALRELRPGG